MDWKGSDKWEIIGEKLKQIGCELLYLPYTDGISTTDIVKKIKDGQGI
jgi:bifunctional ADP-heptose synthase (sugar kinase/adenylyltransferase)